MEFSDKDIEEIARLIKEKFGWVNFLGSVERNLKQIMPLIAEHFNRKEK